MIPVRLVLKDFLSYADPEPLDFTTFQVACLSGPNGVGKSALLDAMTWAVWACARGCEGGINQDRLIRDGADEMTVDFTFELGSSRYRIVRKRSRAGKADVQFLLRDGDAWKNIAGESLKETDAKIAAVLRMDYRTFTASAFFVQGRSEDFLSRMKPDERKDVFARLLDLGTYEKLEDAARERAKDAERDRKEIAARVEDLAADAPDVEKLEAEIVELGASMKTIDERSTAATADLKAARDALSALQATAARLQAERDALATAQRAIADATKDGAAKRTDLEAIDELLGRADEVTKAIEEIAVLTSGETDHRERQERAAALDARCAELRAVIDGERKAIEQRVGLALSSVTKLDDEIASLEDAKSEVGKLRSMLEGSADVAAALDDARAVAEALSVDGARLKEQVAQLEVSSEKAHRNLDVLADGGGECPVCGSALDAKHRTKVKRDIEKEIKDATKARDAANAELEVARKEAVRCREDIKRLEGAIRERDELTSALQALLGRLERSDAAHAERTSLSDAIGSDERILSEGTYAIEARDALAAVTQEVEGLYDADAHAKLRARLEALAPYAGLKGRLDEAQRSRERLIADIETATARAQQMQKVADVHAAAIETFSQELSGLVALEHTVEEGEEALRSLQHLAADAAAEQARLEERLASARTVAAELAQARADERAAADAHRRYRRLVEAFGPAGIPTLIIDNALPELTEDANRILGRLSDHEMSVQFRLQRETKAGKPKETFEALVHHDGGVRDFAMFSGGEAFRVAFAVRLAMSKLLVRRAGARLETLVIDEGFGTQDPEGRERLVEAINLVRQEFAKVLVITHLDDLKDQFGTQIRVEKGPTGSVLEVVGS
jgi:exonuclease SbcC